MTSISVRLRRSKSARARLIVVSLLLGVCALLPAAIAHSPEVDAGLAWLSSQVTSGGGFQTENASIAVVPQVRAEALHALTEFATAPATVKSSVSAGTESDTELIARRMISLARAGQNVQSQIPLLLLAKNTDGGFAESAGLQSNALDTAWALLALKSAGAAQNSAVATAVSYLSGAMNADGGFATPQGESQIYVTSYALLALVAYRDLYLVSQPITKSAAWLRSQQNASGGYGDTLDNAVAALALQGATSDAAVFAGAHQGLRQAQTPNGSWANDPFLTALAVRALGPVTTPPPPSLTTGTITGRVLDGASQSPIVGASISVSDVNGTTSSNGSFDVGPLQPGSYTLSILKSGYAPVDLTVSVTAGATRNLGNIGLQPAGQSAIIRGQVLNGQTGAPFEGASIQVIVNGAAPLTTSSASDGSFQISGVSLGTATIEVSAAGYQTVTGTAQLAGGTYLFSPALYPDAETLPTQARIQGLTVDAGTGLPLAGVTVTVAGNTVVTASNGRFDIPGLATGPADGSATANGYAALAFSTVLSRGLNDIGTLRLATAGSTVTLSGVVRNTTGQALPNALVTVQSSNASTTTNSAGEYQIAGIPQTQFNVVVEADGYLSRTLSVSAGSFGAYTADFQLEPNSASGITLDVATHLGTYDPFLEIEVTAHATNNSGQDKTLLFVGTALDAQRNPLQNINFVKLPREQNVAGTPVLIPAGTTVELGSQWYNLDSPAGDYSIAVKAINASDRSTVLAQASTRFTVAAKTVIGGGITLSPPVVQAGTNVPVSIKAQVINHGNQPIPATPLKLEVILDKPDLNLPPIRPLSTSILHQGAPINEPLGGAFDSLGNYYFANYNDRKVFRLTPSGALELVTTLPSSQFPLDVAVDAANKIWVLALPRTIVGLNSNGPSTVIELGIPATPASFDVDGDDFLVTLIAEATGVSLVRVRRDGSVTTLINNGLIQPQYAVQDGDSVLVTNRADNTIARVSSTGNIVTAYTGLNRPAGIARDAAGFLYVVNTGSNSVVKIDPATGIKTTFATGIPTPIGIALDSSGTAFVSASQGIYRVTPGGAVSLFARSLFSIAQSLEYDGAGNLLVSGFNPSTLVRVQPDGAVESLASPGAVANDLTRGPGGVIYAAMSNGTVTRLDGNVLTQVATGLLNPTGIVLDDAGVMYAAEGNGFSLSRVPLNGAPIEPILSSFLDSPFRTFLRPDGTQVIVNRSSVAQVPMGGKGSIWVGLSTNFQEADLAADGSLYLLGNGSVIQRVSANGTVTTLGAYAGATKIAAGDAGELFMVQSNMLVRLDISAGTTTNITSLGFSPNSMLRDPDGNFYFGTSAGIRKVTPSGSVSNFGPTLGSIGSLSLASSGKLFAIVGGSRVDEYATDGTRTTRTSSLSGVATSVTGAADGRFYVVYSNATLVQEYSATGQPIGNIAGFNRLVDVAYAWGRLVFSDANFQRVYALRDDGNPEVIGSVFAHALKWDGSRLLVHTPTGIMILSQQGQLTPFYSPAGVNLAGLAIAADGRVGTIISNDSRLIQLSGNGDVLSTYASIVNPSGLAFDQSGNLFAAGAGPAGTVIKFPSGSAFPELHARLPTSSAAEGLAFGPDGTLYASVHHSLYRISQSGAVTTAAPSGGTLKGIVFTDQLIGVDEGGMLRRFSGNQMVPYAVGLGRGRAVISDGLGGAYIAGGDSGSVTRFIGGGLRPFVSGLANPNFLTRTSSGGLLVSGPSAVYTVSASGEAAQLGINSVELSFAHRGLTAHPDGSFRILSAGYNSIIRATLAQTNTLPVAGTLVYSATANLPALGLRTDPVDIDFGEFVPPYGGDYLVQITPLGSGVSGGLGNTLHVGPHARASLLADQTVVPPGSPRVAVQASIVGADFSSLSTITAANVRKVASSTRPIAMGADPQGRIIFSDFTDVYRIEIDGTRSVIYHGGTTSFGELPVDAQGNVYIGTSDYKLMKVTPGGQAITIKLLPFSTTIRSMDIDSQGRIVAWLTNGTIVRIASDGSETFLYQTTLHGIYALTLDGHDNIYVLENDTISRLTADGEFAVFLSGARFEYEGVTVTGDCANNLLIAPELWPAFNQAGEEYTIIQLFGRSGTAASAFNGLTVAPQIPDIDHMIYDRFGGRLLFWTDILDSPIFAIPATCGAISVDLHMVIPPDQTASGFNSPPTSQINRDDGSIEYRWNLQNVTNFGKDIRFDAGFTGLKVGDERPIAKEAFLVFKNTFSPEDVKLPIDIPTVQVAGSVSLNVSTDRAAYPARTDVLSTVALTNLEDQPVPGRLAVRVIGADGTHLATLQDDPMVLAPSAQVIVSPPFNTGDYPPGSFIVIAEFLDEGGNIQAKAQAAFDITASGATGENPEVTSSVIADKIQYSNFATVQLRGRVRNQAVNFTYERLIETVSVAGPGGAVIYTASSEVQQLLAGTLQDRNFTLQLVDAPAGTYTVSLRVTLPSGQEVSSSATTFAVVNDKTLSLAGTVAVSKATLDRGEIQTCTDTLTNRSQQGVTDQPIRQLFAKLDQEAPITSADSMVSLAGNATQALTPRVIDTDTLSAPGDYVCVLQAQVGDSWIGIGSGFFRLNEPPVVLAGTVVADKSSLEQGETLNCAATVNNNGKASLTGQTVRQLLVTQANTTVSQAESILNLSRNGSQNLTRAIDSIDLSPGGYACVLQANINNAWQTLDTDTFIVTAPLPHLTATVTVAQAVVQQGTDQVCTDTVTHTSRLPLTGQSLRQLVRKVSPATDVSSSVVSRDFTSNGTQILIRNVDTDTLTAGDYSCDIEASISGQWKLLASERFKVDQPPLRVDQTLERGDKGRLLVLMDGPQSKPDDRKLCQNGVADVLLEADFDPPLSPDALVEVTLKNGLGLIIDTETGKPGSFSGEVNARLNNKGPDLSIKGLTAGQVAVHLVGQTAQTLLGSKYQIVVSATEGALRRTSVSTGLIDLACNVPYGVGDVIRDAFTVIGFGSDPADNEFRRGIGDGVDQKTVSAQKTSLQALLQQQGWTYTITDNAKAFSDAFHSGGYAHYALLSEYEVVSEYTQKELREAVHAGAGLLVAGRHDVRNRILDESLGIQYKGAHLSPQRVDLLASDLFTPNQITFAESGDRVQRSHLAGAEKLGRIANGGTQDTAVARQDYGLGKAVYVGFDLLAETSLAGLGSTFADLLAKPITYIHPAQTGTDAGRAVPIRLTLENRAIANSSTVTVTSSMGGTLLQSAQGTITSNVLTWTTNLTAGETKTLDLWVKLPLAGIPVTVTANLNATSGSFSFNAPVATIQLNPMIPPGLADAVTDLTAYVQAQPNGGLLTNLLGQLIDLRTPAARALEYLQRADQAMNDGRLNDARADLLAATDQLKEDKKPAITPIRLKVDRAIVEVQQLLY